MNDLISRKAAIDAIEKNAYRHTYLDQIVDIINALPIEQSEQESAEWVKNDNGTYSCSKCKSWIPKEQRYYARFCLHCGSKMERERINEWGIQLGVVPPSNVFMEIGESFNTGIEDVMAAKWTAHCKKCKTPTECVSCKDAEAILSLKGDALCKYLFELDNEEDT